MSVSGFLDLGNISRSEDPGSIPGSADLGTISCSLPLDNIPVSTCLDSISGFKDLGSVSGSADPDSISGFKDSGNESGSVKVMQDPLRYGKTQLCDTWTHSYKTFSTVIGLFHPLDGITNLKYGLLCFLTPNKKKSKRKAIAFNRDRSCHLALCLRLILLHLLFL